MPLVPQNAGPWWIATTSRKRWARSPDVLFWLIFPSSSSRWINPLDRISRVAHDRSSSSRPIPYFSRPLVVVSRPEASIPVTSLPSRSHNLIHRCSGLVAGSLDPGAPGSSPSTELPSLLRDGSVIESVSLSPFTFHSNILWRHYVGDLHIRPTCKFLLVCYRSVFPDLSLD